MQTVTLTPGTDLFSVMRDRYLDGDCKVGYTTLTMTTRSGSTYQLLMTAWYTFFGGIGTIGGFSGISVTSNDVKITNDGRLYVKGVCTTSPIVEAVLS